ncbi:MAG: hypothetical protein CMA12_01535 [Euryarchaeota archaeon]|nr:hypothetical protein [Euryarchaeota archaeon]OUW22922.1 MAG: hypothetical protein CBD33_00110 [Euryarchaeota archaeon TMED173]
MDEGQRSVPDTNDSPNEKLLFLRENMVHLTDQLSMPVIEIALVVSKYIRILLDSLKMAASKSDETLPETILFPIPIEPSNGDSILVQDLSSFPLEKLIDRVDQDRIDILDTLIRTVVNESELEFTHALQELRQWEVEIRKQLSEVSSPGGLFSPLVLSDGF